MIAHEFGHHIQNLLGTSDKVAQVQRSSGETAGNAASVRLELQADCYAGVWAAQNRDRLDPGDIEEGLTAAHAIGDDTLQQESQGRVVPDSFTHGTSAERMHWLKRGLDGGVVRVPSRRPPRRVAAGMGDRHALRRAAREIAPAGGDPAQCDTFSGAI